MQPAWDRIKDVLHQAMQLPAEQRAGFLDDACTSDAALRAEVESLLFAAAHLQGSFLESEAPVPAESMLLREGEIFAERFRLLHPLGEGGMGQVWLAEQLAPVNRRVALKLVKAGMYDAAMMQRFQAERQSLAMMDHPAIAKVFEAGATALGQPYFVMEYVPGLPITEYCDRNKLTIRQRIALFIQACEGVQHAHLKAIIHRDLKPANILVLEIDGEPVPRIIDFGLAKALVATENVSAATQFGYFLGTPGYMSPEQVDPDMRDVDTRSDVYSLGALLYVLLAGLKPFEIDHSREQPISEWLRRLREEEPLRPSARIGGADRKVLVASAAARGTEPSAYLRQLRGDLDCIALKALERDRARRYASPSELAEDLNRHLSHEPVLARSAGGTYRLRKYVRRHGVAIGITAVLVCLLTAFSLVQSVELKRITQERDRANRERDHAARVTDFMTGMFKVSDPSEARGVSITAREILDKASKQMETGLANDPEEQAQLMQVMARTYLNLGLYARAHELAKRAFDTRLALLGPADPATLDSMTKLGWIMEREGNKTEAEQLERRALALELPRFGLENLHTLETMIDLGVVLADGGHNEEAEKLQRQAVEIGTRIAGEGNFTTMTAINNLGNVLRAEGRYHDAEAEYRRLYNASLKTLGPDDLMTLRALDNVTVAVDLQGRHDEAEPLYRQNLEAWRRVVGPEHQDTVIAMEDLAILFANENRLADAEPLLREALAVDMRTLGPNHPATLNMAHNFAELLGDEGRYEEAEKIQRETIAGWNRALGPDNPSTLETRSALAETLNKEGHYTEAETVARETFDVELPKLGPYHPYTLDALKQLGIAMAHRGRYPEAADLFHRAMAAGNAGAQGNPWGIWYAFASVAAAANRSADALRCLHEAVTLGYKDVARMQADEDLKNLRDNAQFRALIAELAPHGTGNLAHTTQ